MLPFICLRSIKLTLENGTCKYSLNGFVTFALILCLQMKLPTVRIGCKIGAISMSALDRVDYSDIKSRVDLAYNTMVRIYTHPIQKCAEGTFKVRQLANIPSVIIHCDKTIHQSPTLFAGI